MKNAKPTGGEKKTSGFETRGRPLNEGDEKPNALVLKKELEQRVAMAEAEFPKLPTARRGQLLPEKNG